MFDYIYARYSIKREPPLRPDFTPERAIVSKKLLNHNSDKLCVVIPGWHNHPNSFPINRLVRRLVKKGWAVLIYDFHDQILEPDDKTVVASFRHIRETINEDLCALAAKNKYRKIHMLSISLGGVTLGLIADTFRSFDSATVVVGGDDLAIDMWYGLRTQPYRKSFNKLHLGIRRLDHEWEGLSPVNHLKHFKDKPVKVVLATADKFVLTKYQKRLVKRLQENGALVKVRKNHLGHALTIVWFCLFGSIE